MLINFGSFRFQIQKYALREAVRPKEGIGEVFAAGNAENSKSGE